ncbi:YlxR family protein [Pseudalkalibacillus hwajinpoensis]|uniref:RNase P modulator RnpM n=1 Tax=Guptibacillus hwajinpoensis TaxID=208199 RepID=UPI00325BB12A
MQKRKIPMRKCVACQEMKPKKELVRVVRSPEGVISIDLTGKQNGRGAYLCNNEECFKLAKKRNALSAHLKAEVTDEIYTYLEESRS